MPTRFLLFLAGASLLVLVILAPTRHLDQSGAEAAALKAVPGRVLKHAELSSLHGEPVWNLEVAQPGKSTPTVVTINARTQQVQTRMAANPR